MPVCATDVADAMLDARCRLLTQDPWFGTFASYFTWISELRVSTIGVILKSQSKIECVYNPEFISKLSIGSMMAAIEHELMHVVLMHMTRCGSRNQRIWNFATDMVINGTKTDPNIEFLIDIETEAGHTNEDGEFIPFGLIWYPSNWPKNLTSEELYERLEQHKIVIRTPGSGPGGKGDEVIHDGGGETIIIDGSTLDDHGTWAECEISEDEARQIVKDICEQTTAQVGSGSIPGSVIGAISKLDEPIRNWKQELSRYVGRKYGGKRRTYSRQNRRRQAFGTPGKSSHASAPLTVALDTSASVDQMRLEQFMTELESMSQRFKITLVQFDSAFQSSDRYHRGDWQEFEVHGRGGTSFVNLFEALDEKELWGRVTIICTDGDATWPDERDGRDVLWVIFPHRPIKDAPKPPFGEVIYLER